MTLRLSACVVALMTLCPGAFARSKTAQFSQVDLFRQGENTVHTYRIPALVETANDVVIAVVDARWNSSQDLPGPISLVMRRSLDGGKTWEPMRIILKVKQGGVGDASLLFDHSTGRIWCFHAYGPPGIGFRTAEPGAKTGPSTLQVHAMHSDDQGATWSKDVDLTPRIKDPAWQAVFATSGTDIQLSSGRYLVPLVVKDSKGVIHSVNAYSDDRGKTWKVGKFIGTDTDESHTVELRNGAVMQNMRDGGTRAVALSLDGGERFGRVRHDSALIDPSCNAGITRYRFGKKGLLIFTNDSSHRRENLTVRVSYDEGHTWPRARVINPGPSGYSTVIRLNDGSIGVLYERGEASSDEGITFARFSLGWALQAPGGESLSAK